MEPWYSGPLANTNHYANDRLIALVGWVFANGSGDLGSIPGRVISKTLKIEFDTPLLNTQWYKVRIKGKVEQSKQRRSALPYTLLLKKEPLGHPRLRLPTYIYIYIYLIGDRSRERPEGSFSIATTPMCKGGRYPFPWIAHLYPWYVPYIAKC